MKKRRVIMSNGTGTNKATSLEEVQVISFNSDQRTDDLKNGQVENKDIKKEAESKIINELDSAADNMKSLSFDNLFYIIKDMRRSKVVR